MKLSPLRVAMICTAIFALASPIIVNAQQGFDGRSPISTSVLVANALRDGTMHLPNNYAPPAAGPLPNVQASGGGRPVNENPIVANPKNPKQVLSGGNDYNCSNTQGFYSSSDGGKTWSHFCMQAVAGHSGAGDPAVGYDLNGNSYIVGIDGTNPYEIVFQKSSNNGGSWSAPAVAVNTLFSGGITDKEWLQVDVNAASPHANALYISVTQFDPSSNSEITVSHSYDGGATWTRVPVDSEQFYPNNVDQFSDLAVGKDGTVYVTWMRCNATGPAGDCGGTQASMMFSKSTDGGSTWSSPVLMTKVNLAPDNCGAFYGCLPNTAERVSNIPAVDIDNSTGSNAGTLYAVMYTWTGSKMQVGVIHSTNGGSSWSSFVPVSGSSSGDQFFPWLTVSTTGIVGVTWLDRRDDPSNLKYITYGSGSTNGGASFVASKKLGTAASNPLNDGFGGSFMGDYTGNYWDATTLAASWMDSRSNVNMQDEVGGYALK